MIIALDYDKTYTEDKIAWNKFVILFEKAGHKIICITMRRNDDEERLGNVPFEVFYTSRKAKLIWAEENNIKVDIWIDDKPAWLFEDAL